MSPQGLRIILRVGLEVNLPFQEVFQVIYLYLDTNRKHHEWNFLGVFKQKRTHLCVSTCLLQAPKMADLTDAPDPAVHLLFRFGHQVEDARGCFHHEQVLPVKVPFYTELPVKHLDLTLLQVDGPDGLLGVLALVVLQNIWIPAHAPSSEDKPAFAPCLRAIESILVRMI